jgi:hypothetical protein
LYLHLAFDSVQVAPGDIVARGQALAISGETGMTCDGEESGPGPHLHFQVQRSDEGKHFTQSLPVAFDDISGNEGVPVEGTSYVSGNFGRGKAQKIKLTPHRAERVFAPKAKPADPSITEVQSLPPEALLAGTEGDLDSWVAGVQTASAAGTPAPTSTETATATPTETLTPTPMPLASDTPVPAATPTPVIVDTATPMPSDTPPPEPSDTPSPEPSDTPPPVDSPTPTP